MKGPRSVITASVAAASSRKRATGTGADKEKATETETEKDIAILLRQHNERFRPEAAYEPSRHSMRDVRRWEQETGKTWSQLTPKERERANKAIDDTKRMDATKKATGTGARTTVGR